MGEVAQSAHQNCTHSTCIFVGSQDIRSEVDVAPLLVRRSGEGTQSQQTVKYPHEAKKGSERQAGSGLCQKIT